MATSVTAAQCVAAWPHLWCLLPHLWCLLPHLWCLLPQHSAWQHGHIYGVCYHICGVCYHIYGVCYHSTARGSMVTSVTTAQCVAALPNAITTPHRAQQLCLRLCVCGAQRANNVNDYSLCVLHGGGGQC